MNILSEDGVAQNNVQVHEEFIDSLIPHCDQIFPEVTGTSSWNLGNTIPIYLNTSTSQNVGVDESVSLVNSESTNLYANVISSSIYLPNEVLILNPQSDGEIPNSTATQVFKDNLFINQKLIVNKNINERIEMVSAHKCKICGALYEKYDAITSHIHTSHGPVQGIKDMQNKKMNEEIKNLYLCGKCDEKSVVYDSIEQLKLHMIAGHNFEDVDESQELSDELLKKMVHSQEIAKKKVKCMIKGCENSFACNEIMLKHMEYHTDGMKKHFKCRVCDKLFFIWRTCRAHIWKEHRIDVGLYECPMCKSFKCLAPYDLLAHMKIHSNRKDFKPFLCSTCGMQFNRLAELENHANSHAAGKTWNVNCPKCDKSFANNKYLKRHIQSVHDQYKPFICNICGHKCARKSMLDLHLRQHTGEKPYKCALCEFKTGDHNSFRRHGLRHSGLLKYACKHCKYATIQSTAFMLHMKKNHPGEAGFFSCETCPFHTVNEKLFRQHNDKHKREKTPSSFSPSDKTKDSPVPNVEDEETQIGLFPDHLEDTVDTGGITIPAGIENN